MTTLAVFDISSGKIRTNEGILYPLPFIIGPYSLQNSSRTTSYFMSLCKG